MAAPTNDQFRATNIGPVDSCIGSPIVDSGSVIAARRTVDLRPAADPLPRTVSPFDSGIEESGVPRQFHPGLGAVNGAIGVVGNSNGNLQARIVPPDRYIPATDRNRTDIGNGGISPASRRVVPAITKGQ